MWRILNKSTPAHAWIIGLVFVGFASQCDAETFDYASFNRALGRVVNTQGGVDYEAAKTDADLQAFVDQLAQISPDTHPALFSQSSRQPCLLDQCVQRMCTYRDLQSLSRFFRYRNRAAFWLL